MKKYILIFIIFLIFFILIYTSLKLIMIEKIINLSNLSNDFNNIQIITTSADTTITYLKKDDIEKINSKNNDSNGITLWKNKKNSECYTFIEQDKTYYAKEMAKIDIPIIDKNIKLSFLEKFKIAINPSINIIEGYYEDKKCYKYFSFKDSIYFDYNTGIILYQKSDNTEIKSTLVFDNITNDDIKLPNLNTYTKLH